MFYAILYKKTSHYLNQSDEKPDPYVGEKKFIWLVKPKICFFTCKLLVLVVSKRCVVCLDGFKSKRGVGRFLISVNPTNSRSVASDLYFV